MDGDSAAAPLLEVEVAALGEEADSSVALPVTNLGINQLVHFKDKYQQCFESGSN